MAYEIEKGVPLPAPRSGRTPSPLMITLRAMQPGDSVLVPSGTVPRNTLSSIAVTAGRELGGKFTVRSVDGGLRVWRIA